MKLKDKVAIITGAGRGLGREMALAYAQEGANLVLAARTTTEIASVAREVQALGRKAIAVPADVSREKDVQAMVQKTLEAFGRVDILVSNAGVGLIRTIADTTLEEWNRVLATNLTGPFLCARAVFPPMMAQRSGVIINISSGLGRRGRPAFGAYGASKGGLELLTQVLADEGAPYHIRAHALAPGGATVTRLAMEIGQPPETMLRPEVIRASAVWLASDESAGVTGQSVDAVAWNQQRGLGGRESWLWTKGK